QAGSLSWKAWFFGALDKSSFITVDKPPGALWVMGLSARLFGYSTLSCWYPRRWRESRRSGCSPRRYAGWPGRPPGCSRAWRWR
ncbi:MAG: hypothetical protein ACRDPO_36360, partial [Streptosporangiaceae bacterium]